MTDRTEFTQAEGIFMKASAEKKAHVPSQAALIALECKRLGLNPIDYAALPIANQEVCGRLIIAAQKAHSNIPDTLKPKISEEKVRQIFYNDFTLAQALLKFNEKELGVIYDDLYNMDNGIFTKRPGKFEEKTIRKFWLVYEEFLTRAYITKD